jgi:hypothetical protein
VSKYQLVQHMHMLKPLVLAVQAHKAARRTGKAAVAVAAMGVVI